MKNKTVMLGIEYGRGCLRTAIPDGPALGPSAVREMFPDMDWTMVVADKFDADECRRDRFGENFKIQQKIYSATPDAPHIMIGGDHSVNYGHFVALANRIPETDLCLVYIDAHLDIHTPESAVAQASGAPHGTNVRALLGDGDARWLSLQHGRPVLRPENLFYLGTRSYEPAEIEFATQSNIFIRAANQLQTPADVAAAIDEVRRRIGDKPFVVSFDFDAIDPRYFRDVLVPAGGGITVDTAKQLILAFNDADNFEFVEYAPSGDPQSAEIVRTLIDLTINKKIIATLFFQQSRPVAHYHHTTPVMRPIPLPC